MGAEGVDRLFDGAWPRLKGYSVGQAAWNRALNYSPVPNGVDLEPSQLLYVAIDTIFEGAARLVVSRWPKQGTDGGRLTFGNTVAIWESSKGLGELIATTRHVPAAEGLASDRRDEVVLRPISAGDVFASRRPDGLSQISTIPDYELTGWLEPPIIDLTAEMRLEAKAAFYGAVAPVLDSTHLRRVHGGD